MPNNKLLENEKTSTYKPMKVGEVTIAEPQFKATRVEATVDENGAITNSYWADFLHKSGNIWSKWFDVYS